MPDTTEIEVAPPAIEIPEEISWQTEEKVETTPVETTEDTPKEDTSVDDFFNLLFQDEGTDDKKETVEATPTEDPFHNPEKKSDIYEKQIEQLSNDAKAKDEEYNKVKPILETLEKNPILKKFVDAVSSWKLTVEWVFKQFAEAQMTKTSKTTASSTGTIPQEEWLMTRMNKIAQASRATFENDVPKG